MNTGIALCKNNVLQHFTVFGHLKANDDVEKCYAEMLEYNCTLKRLDLPYASSWRPKIDMLLEFNCNGRKQFTSQSESVSLPEWVDLFAKNSFDINFVYYFLRHVSPLLRKGEK